MASGVVKAVLDKYATLDAAGFPGGVRTPIYFGTAVTGYTLPAVVVKDCSVRGRERLDAREVLETHTLRVEVYAETAADCEAILAAVLYDGQPVGDRAGFEDGDLPGLPTGYRLNTMSRAGDAETRGFSGFTPGGGRGFVTTTNLEVEVIAGTYS